MTAHFRPTRKRWTRNSGSQRIALDELEPQTNDPHSKWGLRGSRGLEFPSAICVWALLANADTTAGSMIAALDAYNPAKFDEFVIQTPVNVGVNVPGVWNEGRLWRLFDYLGPQIWLGVVSAPKWTRLRWGQHVL